EQGYLSNDKEHESVSKTLEYAYDDWCIAQFAKMIGNDSVYRQYIQRAQFYKNVFDPQTHHMRGKIQAMWHTPFDPREINNFFTEGNSWQYTFAVPQDINTLIELNGGKESFATKLNNLFTTSSQTTGREQADVTGLIGQYAHGNEPSHHMTYLFNYIGMPWRTQGLVHKICNDFYTNASDGLIGNEDCGQMSAWYIMSALGFYPVCPGSGEYVLGTPVFDKVTIHLENGKQFEVRSKKSNVGSKKSFYVQSVKLNGSQYNKSYLLHTDIMKGGNFEFTLSDKPNQKWGTEEKSFPHSGIKDHQIVPVPFFEAKSNKFKDCIKISLTGLDGSAQVYHSKLTADGDVNFYPQGAFDLCETKEINAYASKDRIQSKIVTQKFYKLPSDKTITILSKVNPMYTAGGSESLIDGIEGTTNWRAGDWQGYFDQDLEAVVDLQKKQPVNHLGVHVLQDVSPWIIYPKEVIFYTSDDGQNFKETARVKNTIDNAAQGAQMQELGTDVNLQARYIKIKAVNGGKLPAWHESAGNPSYLFIDEIIIK
ncbi:MAG: glycosyl hydrolase family 92, partial [Chitinophagaceae bacterium]